jgi:pimeloyl-ACP methyl ester carboxylesterase
MMQWTEGQVFANGLNLHYYRTGGALPPLVLLHGFTDNARCWTTVANILATNYDIVMIDARGHGLSEAPRKPGEFTTSLLAADVLAVIETLHLKQPVLMGHSMGAHTAAVVAYNHPQHVSKLVLEDPPWHQNIDETDEEDMQQFLWGWENSLRSMQAIPLASLIDKAATDNPQWSREEVENWASAQQQCNLSVFTYGATSSFQEWGHIVRGLTVPTLLIIGENQRGAVVTPETATEAVSTMSVGAYVRIAGAGHSIHRDQFEPFMQIVQRFLAKEK